MFVIEKYNLTFIGFLNIEFLDEAKDMWQYRNLIKQKHT